MIVSFHSKCNTAGLDGLRCCTRILSPALCCVIGLISDNEAIPENLPMGPIFPLQGIVPWLPPVHRQPSVGHGCREQTVEDPPPETLERVSGEDMDPRIAEPMVFDLIWPLGAKGGEGEVNVLSLAPLRHKSRRSNHVADPLGLVRRSPDREGLEWAPEIEYAVYDGVELECEVPMENTHLEAYSDRILGPLSPCWSGRHGDDLILQAAAVYLPLWPKVLHTVPAYSLGLGHDCSLFSDARRRGGFS